MEIAYNDGRLYATNRNNYTKQMLNYYDKNELGNPITYMNDETLSSFEISNAYVEKVKIKIRDYRRAQLYIP